jgi:hypothetical protein
MKYKPSTFYANFSMADLVKMNNSRSGIECASGAMGGGSFGGGYHSRGSHEMRYDKTESFTCHLKSVDPNDSNSSELMRSLKADIENRIINSGASLLNSGNMPSGFYLEYKEEGIQGRVELTGDFNGANYFGIRANLKETSTTKKQPLVEKRDHVRRPEGNYHVVRSERDDPRSFTQELYERGQKAIMESNERLRQKYLSDPSKQDSLLQNLEYAEVYIWTPMPPEVKQRFEEAMDEKIEVPEEYDQYGKVYFLNDVALRMYQEAGEVFEVWKIISAEEMAKIPGPSLRGPYVAKGA